MTMRAASVGAERRPDGQAGRDESGGFRRAARRPNRSGDRHGPYPAPDPGRAPSPAGQLAAVHRRPTRGTHRLGRRHHRRRSRGRHDPAPTRRAEDLPVPTPSSRRALAALAAAGTLVVPVAAFADSSTVPVTTVVGATGTRTLAVTDPTGAAIGASGLPLGAGHGGAMLVNVTDLNYQHAGYQVSATMSNFYPWSGSAYDFTGAPIPSSAISVGYPSGLLDLVNVKSLVAPVLHLTGSITVGGLGIPTAINQNVDGATTSVQTLANTVTQSTLAGALAELPVTLQTGQTGAFTAADGLPGEPTAHPNPTSKVLMSGAAQSPLSAALLTALNTAYGGKTAAQLVAAGLLDQNAVVSAVAQQLGITPDLLSGADITSIMSTLTGTVTSLAGSILGQTGSYNTMPTLSINVPSSAAAGVYRGQLVVTLMDT